MRLSRKTKIDLLKAIPLFSRCSRAQLGAVSQAATELSFPAGKVLMRQGTPGRELFVIVDGEVEIERDGAVVAALGGGEFLGELALVTGRPRTATVTARTPVRALILGKVAFDRLLSDVPGIATKVLAVVGERLPPEDV